MGLSDFFVYASKILPDLVLPLPLTFFGLIALVLSVRAPRPRALALGCTLVLWIASNGWVSGAITRSLERAVPAPAELPSADAIVVLGGGTEPAVSPRREIELNDAGDRILYSARLWKRGKAPRVLACSGRAPGAPGEGPEASDMAALLRELGVREDAILEERSSRNTYENAVEARRVLEPLGIRRILLVSSAIHMPRAVGLFRHQGFDVVPAPTDFRAVDLPTLGPWEDGLLRALVSFVLPNAESLAGTSRALREYMGIWVYRALGLLS